MKPATPVTKMRMAQLKAETAKREGEKSKRSGKRHLGPVELVSGRKRLSLEVDRGIRMTSRRRSAIGPPRARLDLLERLVIEQGAWPQMAGIAKVFWQLA